MGGGKSDEERIRDRAYRLWLEEGQPDGKARAHWELASELIDAVWIAVLAIAVHVAQELVEGLGGESCVHVDLAA